MSACAVEQAAALHDTTEAASLDQPTDGVRPAARLVVVHTPDGGLLGRELPLTDELFVLGREVDRDGCAIADKRMSRSHARVALDRRAGLHRIGDANSRNATWVNGQRVDSVLLSDGDVVRLGDTLLVYCERDPMQLVRQRVAVLAPTELHVLLLGESGTGKELLARALHEASGRKGDFVAVNCAAIPKDLVAAELFGHTKQAFSGATQARRGVFAAADGGTLLLDEITDCPLEIQPALLRALQERAVRPVGADRELRCDTRVLSATCLDLDEAAAQGRFRADLLARISQARIALPPLRARRAELLRLAAELVPAGAPALVLTADAAEALLLWHWPMNVRELQSLVAVASATAKGEPLRLQTLGELAPELAASVAKRRETRTADCVTPASDHPPSVAARAQLRPLLEAHGGNVSAVAEALGKPRAQVYRWMRAMGITAERFRNGR